MGVFRSSGQVHQRIKKLQWLFPYPRSEPYFVTWLVPHQIKLTSGRRSKQLHRIPRSADGAQVGRDHSFTRLFKASPLLGSDRLDPSGPVRSRGLGDCAGASPFRWSSSRRPR